MNDHATRRAHASAIARALGPLALVCGGCAGSNEAPAPVAPRPAELVVTLPRAATSAVQPARTRDPSLEPLANAACIVRDGAGAFTSMMPLTFHGKPFARFLGFARAELRGGDRATVTVATDDVVVTGEATLASVVVRPRSAALVDGWIGIRYAAPKAFEREAMILDISLPEVVKPAKPIAITMPCSDLTLTAAPEADASAEKDVYLKPGLKAAFLRTPGGERIASIETAAAPKPAKGSRGHVDELDDERCAGEIGRIAVGNDEVPVVVGEREVGMPVERDEKPEQLQPFVRADSFAGCSE